MRKTWLVLLLIAAATPAARAQIDCSNSNSSKKLSCLIPTTVTPSGYTFSSASPNPLLQNSFGFLTADVGGETSQIPLASPASGIIFTTDPTLHVPVPSNESLGPILTQRAETIGRHKVYIAATYQYFLLEDVDGLSLKSLPSVFYLNSANCTPNVSCPDTVAAVNGRIDLKIHQFVGYVTYGLTSRVDISAAIPVLRVDMRYTSSEQLFDITTGNQQGGLLQASNAKQATGIGDIVLAIKGTVWKLEKGGGLAIGTEFRFPTGDALNFLGSGAYGGKPFATFTYGAVVSPHFNVGYQFNSTSQLVTPTTGAVYPRLPNRLIYSGGADWRVFPRLTLAADVLEQRVFDGSRAVLQTGIQPFTNSADSFSSIRTSAGSYNRTDGSIGIKLKPTGNLLLTGNLLVKLDRNGLRERLAPLLGISYTF